MKFLNKYNYAEYLKKLFMIGQIDPWRRTDEGAPLYTILVPFDIAYDECVAKCKELEFESFTKGEFRNYLKLNDIIVFNNVTEFGKANLGRAKKPRKKMSEERRKRLQEQVKEFNKAKIVV